MHTVLITGSRGFIGRHLLESLCSISCEIIEINSSNTPEELEEAVKRSNLIFHLAAVHRTSDSESFNIVNYELTKRITEISSALEEPPLIVLSSSTQVSNESLYGKSKKKAEEELIKYNEATGKGYIFRLHNVFGEYCKPNYNSVIATFCHNISNGLPVTVNENNKDEIEFLYVKDIVNEFINFMHNPASYKFLNLVKPRYKATIQDLADIIKEFKDEKSNTSSLDSFHRKLYKVFSWHNNKASFVANKEKTT